MSKLMTLKKLLDKIRSRNRSLKKSLKSSEVKTIMTLIRPLVSGWTTLQPWKRVLKASNWPTLWRGPLKRLKLVINNSWQPKEWTKYTTQRNVIAFLTDNGLHSHNSKQITETWISWCFLWSSNTDKSVETKLKILKRSLQSWKRRSIDLRRASKRKIGISKRETVTKWQVHSGLWLASWSTGFSLMPCLTSPVKSSSSCPCYSIKEVMMSNSLRRSASEKCGGSVQVYRDGLIWMIWLMNNTSTADHGTMMEPKTVTVHTSKWCGKPSSSRWWIALSSPSSCSRVRFSLHPATSSTSPRQTVVWTCSFSCLNSRQSPLLTFTTTTRSEKFSICKGREKPLWRQSKNLKKKLRGGDSSQELLW